MTIEEAIVQLKDLRKDRESFLEKNDPDSPFAKDIEAIDVALEHMDLNGTYISMTAHLKLMRENAELKRLLRLAVEDIGKHSFCSMCENRSDDSKCKKCKAVTLDMFKWKHAEEALRLIEGEKNV